jgi:hypothetical protein
MATVDGMVRAIHRFVSWLVPEPPPDRAATG